MEYEMFDDYLAYNEDQHRVVYWTTYGENNEYFLSKAYDYVEDFLTPLEDSEFILINVEVTDDLEIDALIEASKQMVF